MSELMAHRSQDEAGDVVVTGSDVVAIGYVAAAVARESLPFLVRGGGGGGSSSSHHFLFCAALSTFFRALLVCDTCKESQDALADAAARYSKPLFVTFEHCGFL
jgi:hypothetical protein